MSVNLSGNDIAHPGLVARVTRALVEARLAAAAPDARADREHPDAAPRGRAADAARAAPARRGPERRRLRHRLLVAAPPVDACRSNSLKIDRALRRTACRRGANDAAVVRAIVAARRRRSARRSSPKASRRRRRWSSCAQMGCVDGPGLPPGAAAGARWGRHDARRPRPRRRLGATLRGPRQRRPGALPLSGAGRSGPHIPLNSPVKLRLTSSFSGWPFTLTSWRPRRSRVTPAIALMLTSVERWICQNSCGSSSSTSSLIGLRISASTLRGLHARVLLVADEEQHVVDRDHLDRSGRPWPGSTCRYGGALGVQLRRQLVQQLLQRRRRSGRVAAGARCARRLRMRSTVTLQALALGRLQHVVDHALLEGLDRVLVVGGDEDDLAAVAMSSVGRQLRDLRAPLRRRSGRACGCRGRRCRAGAASTSSTASTPFFASATISSSGQTSASRARNCSRISRSSSAITAARHAGSFVSAVMRRRTAR